jgi:hypothetical protein
MRVRMRPPFGEDKDCAALPEHLRQHFKRGAVPLFPLRSFLFGGLFSSHDRNATEEVEERPQQRDPPQRGFRDEDDGAWKRLQREHRVHEPV